MKPRLIITAGILLALATGIGSRAGETKRGEIESFKQWSKGEANGVEIHSKGQVSPTWGVDSVEAPVDGIWSMALGKGGSVYLGTGNSGKVLVYRNGSIKELAKTEHVAITKIRVDKSGRIWFAAIPEGTIYRMDASGKVKKIARTGEDYVWDFILESGGVVAATGPNGKILKISGSGKVTDYLETGEEHVMCLLKGGDGKLYAGTSGDGLVLEVSGKGKVRVVHDFTEKEVKSLAWVGKGKDGTLVAAVNRDAGTRPSKSSPARLFSRDREKKDKSGDDHGKEGKSDKAEQQIVIDRSPAPRGRGRVSGAVYAINSAGGARRLVELPKRAVVDMAVAGDDIYVATDQEGKVYRCRADEADYAISFDLAPAQVLSLVTDDKGPLYFGTGSSAALVKVKRGSKGKANYITEVLDAGFPARWGMLDYEADGSVRILTRSGNIKEPERGWSQWKAASGNPASIKSPEARYLQVKVEWPAGSNAQLRSISIPYRVYNQPHYLDAVMVDSAQKDKGHSKNRGKVSGPIKSRSKKSGPASHSTARKIMWKVTNPDSDPLRFDLFFQPQGTKQWIAIKSPVPITKTKYTWETESIPDGWYRIKVEATDAPANPPDEATEAEGISERFLVDNTRPQVKSLSVTGKKGRGKAVDSMSAISGIQYAIDGGDWVTLNADDGVLDSKQEGFSFSMPDDLERGPHVIAVRAWDRAFNLGTSQEQFNK